MIQPARSMRDREWGKATEMIVRLGAEKNRNDIKGARSEDMYIMNNSVCESSTTC